MRGDQTRSINRGRSGSHTIIHAAFEFSPKGVTIDRNAVETLLGDVTTLANAEVVEEE